MLGRLLGMLGREERIHMIERGLRQVVVGDALGYVGMLVGVFGAWAAGIALPVWAFSRLAKVQEPGRSCREAGGGRGLGAI